MPEPARPLTIGPEHTDTLFNALLAAPFRLREPDRQAIPFVFASPHSGRDYPLSFVRSSRLSPLNLRRSEDAFVDELFADALDVGAPLIAVQFPRAFLDVNRGPTELDAAMFDGPLEMPVDASSPRVTAGLGVIPRIVRDGAEIYRGKLRAREAEERLALFYHPYHAALGQLVHKTYERFGAAVLIDCHSMPSAAAAPDIVIGDRYGLAAAPLITRCAERAFEAQGFRVARNLPYAGGYTTQLHGRPARGVHALQIEINRGLYLDEERVAKTPNFVEIESRIATALREIANLGSLLAGRPDAIQAAE
ncbi:MAG: N-formylglutamate amidohydrolase [Rhizomicrobium sp.]|jgi:N-formylglutamate deformylase